MADKSIDDYLATLGVEQRAIAQALRALVRTAAPGAREVIKWSQPVFEIDGPMCWIKAHKGHVTLGFWRGMQLPSAQGLIEGTGEKMGHIKLRTQADLKPAELQKLVREAMQLNRERGDPTRNP
ncbi:DUF1801 domain-containing protein [Aquincola tertiaricarbonis]|uniref:DUF1801 domain-containing protein n=1 Tax=Aquincola tertiaricarbonis TaxID=391953 RepID=A0ABY4S2W4_AQUTE|nr:DUF1801 domain-containing protein [Aquincola tertiaricarbonis]URI07339.1 DUF1801 domain-containing protein [Aquincola tertiaricarbonis]